MIFDSVEALFYMEGHGVYVWSVYVSSILCFLGMALRPIIKKKYLVKTIRQRMVFNAQETR